jgi:hypothetical protein
MGLRRRHVLDDPAVVEDVLDRDAVDQHEVVGEQPSMAAPPHRLRAHHGDVARPGEREQLVDSGAELAGAHVVGVGPELLVAQAGVRRVGDRSATAAERGHPRVGEPVLRQPRGHGSGRELGVPATARVAADVDQGIEADPPGECGEVLRAQRAVAHGADPARSKLSGHGALRSRSRRGRRCPR